MKTLRSPFYILTFLYLCFVGYLVFSAWQLPERVASHFGAQGQPDGWMSRSNHLLLMAVFGFAFPLFLVGLFFVLRFVPEGLNVPDRDYWLAPSGELRRSTIFFAKVSGWLAWLFALSLEFITWLYMLISNGTLTYLHR